jgi:molybdate transport system regulatory protein
MPPTLAISSSKIRIMLGKEIAIGPGKAELLLALDETGSISKAAKQLGMSYKRAWNLVDTMNRCFKQPVVVTATGGEAGGGARLSPFGREALDTYHRIQRDTDAAIRADMRAFAKLLKS